MGGNQLTGFIPSQLGSLANLTRISLDGNQLTGSIPTQLGSLAQLQWLSLGSNQLTGSIPIQLGNLTNLWWLYLGSNQLTGSIPPELGNATNLTNLDLSSNQLTGFIPAQLGSLTQLIKLRLENNQLSGSIPAELGSLTQLHTLELSNNQLTGSIPAELGSLAQLTILWLEQNQLSGSIPVQLGNLTQLTDLGLRLNQLSGGIPAELGNLTQLTWLGLCGNQLTGNIPPELGNLVQLTWLSLCDSQLTGSIPTEMGNLTQLTELFLHGTELSGEFPTSITNLINLTTLTFDCGLTSSDPAVIAFLNEKSPGWQANQCIPYPSFAAHLPGNQVHAYNWTAGSTLTLTIDDPDILGSPDFQTTGIVPDNDLYGNTWTVFELPNFELKPRQSMSITDGSITKDHVVSTVTVTSVDFNSDIILGTAVPNTIVGINAHYNQGGDYVHRNIIADSNGNWMVNLSIPGSNSGEDRTYDIMTGSWGTAFQWDEDNDSTFYGWRAYVPRMDIGVSNNFICAHDWPEGSVLTLTIDDVYNGTGIDLIRSQEVSPWPDNPNEFTACFDLKDQFDIQPGDEITVTGGGYTKVHTARYLTITEVNPQADTISGKADVGAEVKVWLNSGTNWIFRSEIANSSGIWVANFGIPGDSQGEETIFDLLPNTQGQVRIEDEDNDATQENWSAPPNPFIIVQPNEDRVFGFDWPVGTLLELEIDDPETSQSPDYTASQVFVESDDWGNGFELNGLFDIQPDHVVTVSGENITRQHAVTHLAVTNIDVDADTISGTGYPGAMIHVGAICDETGCATRNINVDENGNWIADFSVPVTGHGDAGMAFDLLPGMSSSAYEFDMDEDATNIFWGIPNPTFNVRANNDQIETWEWNIGSTLTVNIYSSGIETPPADYTTSGVVTGPAPWGDTRNYLSFNLGGLYDIQSEYLVTVSDGTTTKKHIVTSLAFNVMDVDADTVSGFAEPGSNVDVWACDNSN